MGLRFRKSFQLMPGVRINLSSKGLSTTIGGRGASVNIGSRGTYLNAGIPGTGISSRQRLSGGSSPASARAAYSPTPGGTGGAPKKNSFKAILLLGGGFLFLVWMGAQKSTPAPPAALAKVHFLHPVAVLADGVNVREDPSPAGRVVATVSKTDSVEYLNATGGVWASVMLRDGKPGFIATKFLKGLAPPVLAYKFRKAKRHPLAGRRGGHRSGQVAALSPTAVATRSELDALPATVAPISLAEASASSTAASSSRTSSSYGSGGGYYGGSSSHTILTGPRGGHYYINSHGNKSYVRSRRR